MQSETRHHVLHGQFLRDSSRAGLGRGCGDIIWAPRTEGDRCDMKKKKTGKMGKVERSFRLLPPNTLDRQKTKTTSTMMALITSQRDVRGFRRGEYGFTRADSSPVNPCDVVDEEANQQNGRHLHRPKGNTLHCLGTTKQKGEEPQSQREIKSKETRGTTQNTQVRTKKT